MAKSDINAKAKTNSLEKFPLSFEYNRTWGDARKVLRQKTDRS